MEAGEISEFGGMLLFIIGGITFVSGGLLTAWLIRPKRPNIEKMSTYECGEDTVGTAWGNFNIRFYIIALIFILFDVEIVFLFPWATVFGNEVLIAETNGLWGWYSIFEAGIFVFILLLGLAYAWVKGYLEWVKPEIKPIEFKGEVPESEYESFNKNIR